MATWGQVRDKGHLFLTAVLCVALWPLLAVTRVLFQFDWWFIFVGYWLAMGSFSVFFATVLYLLGRPARQSLLSLARRYREHPWLLLPALVMVAACIGAFGRWIGSLLAFDFFAGLEFAMQARQRGRRLSEMAARVLPAAAYLFVGLLLVALYNDIIATVRFYGAYDDWFNRADARLLGGLTAAQLSQWALQHLSRGLQRTLEVIYYLGMFPQMGAAILLTGLSEGRRRAMQYAGTAVVAYFLALLIFFLWPSQGPFYLSPTHFVELRHDLPTYSIQHYLLTRVDALWHHRPAGPIAFDYFIAFPSMHVAHPLIVLWYLRGWRRAVALLILVDLLIVAAILVFEWHYLVDLPAGIAVGLTAIFLVEGLHRQPS